MAEQHGASLWEEGSMPGRVFPGCVRQCCLPSCPSPAYGTPGDSLVQLAYLKPRLPSSHLPGAEINSAFFTAPGFALLYCRGVLVGHAALDGFTGEESPGADKVLSPA